MRGEGLTPVPVFIALLAIFASCIFATLPWWRTLDPMQRDAQYFSWHWGGCVGTAAALGAIIAFAGTQSEILRRALLLGTGQLVGYVLFWLLWAVRHRGGEA